MADEAFEIESLRHQGAHSATVLAHLARSWRGIAIGSVDEADSQPDLMAKVFPFFRSTCVLRDWAEG